LPVNPHHLLDTALVLSQAPQPELDVRFQEPRVQELFEVLRGTSSSVLLRYLWEKFNDPLARSVLNSFFLSEAGYDVIRRATGMTIEAIKTFGEYFFDNSVFRDRLDRFSYANHMSQYGSHMESQYYKAALVCGPEYLTWLLTGDSAYTPKEVLHTQMVDAAFRSQAHRNANITSEVAIEARSWAALAQKAAVTLHKMDPQDVTDAMDQLRLALCHKDDTLSQHVEGAPRPEDILH